MKTNIRDLGWLAKIGAIGGVVVVMEYAIAFGIGFFTGLTA